MVLDNHKRMELVLKKAKQETQIKEITTFIFFKLFGVLMALLAPLFKKDIKKG